jgi:HK97 family phage portal protein
LAQGAVALAAKGIAHSFLSLFRKPNTETKSLAAPEAWLIELFGATPAASGVSVTPKNAMTVPAVRCAVQAISEAIGQLPLHVYRRTDGGKERDTEHQASTLLHDQANDWTPASTFREQLTRDALLQPQGGFAFINRVNGKPVELIRFDPDETQIKVGAANGEPVYEAHTKGQQPRPIARQDIIHIPSPSLCGLIHDGREAIALAMVMERHAAHLFSRGARPAGVLKFPNKLGAETAGRIKTSWQATHGGSNSGGTAVLEEGGEFIPVTFNSVDAQFLELRKFSIEEIARIFRVPPVLLMDFGRATWSNAETVGQQFLTYTLMSWIKRWEGEVRLKLFTPDERKSWFAEFLIDDLLRADFATRMEGYSKAIAARILHPNEARAAENRSPYAGGERFENPNTSTGEAA